MKILLILIAVAISSLFIAQPAYAVDPLSICHQNGSYAGSTTAGSSDVCKQAAQGSATAQNPIINLIKTVIQILSIAIGVISVIMIMVAGLRMIASNGDSQTISSSRNAILYAIVGIFVAIFAQGIVLFVLDRIK